MRDAKLGKSRKTYRIIYEDCREIIVNNMKKYCKDNDYNYSYVIGLIKRGLKNKYGIHRIEVIKR